MSSENVDKFNLEYTSRGRKSHHQELSKDEMLMKDYYTDLNKLMHNLVGPAFLGGASGGFLYGLSQSIKYCLEHKNRPKKLLLSAGLNTVGKNCSRFANTSAAVALLYCLNRRAVNFLFEEEMQELNELQKQMVYGFTTGFLFKFFTKGLASGLLVGIMVGAVSTIPYFYTTYKRKDKI
jgi:hypothetical protein